MSQYNATASTANARLAFPSLEDSPLWADDFMPPAEIKKEETPPLFIIRDKSPRIARAIELMWGTREMDVYFNRLVVNDDNDRIRREGFPREVMAAILKLSADHARRFKFKHKEAKADAWGADRYQRHAFGQ